MRWQRKGRYNSAVEAALEVGKAPRIKEGGKRLVQKFWKKQEGLKKSVFFFDNKVIANFVYIFLVTKWISFYQ